MLGGKEYMYQDLKVYESETPWSAKETWGKGANRNLRHSYRLGSLKTR